MNRVLEMPTSSSQSSPPSMGPPHEVLHGIFEAQADARPEAVAVVLGRQEATYADLEGRANRLARHLRGRGVARGSVVAMLLPRSVDAYAALLGILKAGAAYVPIDPEYPAHRVAYILEDSGASALVTSADLAQSHATFGGAVVRLDADRDAIAAKSPARLLRDEVGVGPRDLCYVIYTSGSTGRPKGVMIEHRSASHLVRAEGRLFAVSSDDRVYQGFSLSFDASVEEVWLAFNAGATLVAATPEMARPGPELSRLLTESGVTVLSCVPTLLSMLEEDVGTLRLLILGGETCPAALIGRWARPGRRVVNTYGPTETTVIATYADLSSGQPVTIGRAVPGYRVYLLDKELRPVQPGEDGEICIGGVGVARGYVGLVDETAERFVSDPFAVAGETDARIYRTGDLGRVDADGQLHFLGRVDGQVKIRGFRVELTEIESALLQGDGLLAAACALREDTPGIRQLVAYVVPRNGDRVDETRLRSYLRSRLPAYMVPGLIETVSELPRLACGKLDRASLPAPQARATRAALTRPRTDTERRIMEVWECLFRPQPVSLHDDFFLDLGGHSLLAARMVSELRKDPCFRRVSVTDVYEHPTIASLAAALDPAKRRLPPRATESSPANRAADRPGERARHLRAGLLQTGGLYFAFGFRALQWITPYLVYFLLRADERSVFDSAAWAAAGAVAVFPLLTLAAVAAKWLVLGRIRAGRHPLWGAYYLRWWFVRSLVAALPLGHLRGTPLLPLVYRLFGARIGRDVHLETDDLAAFDLISIGDGASIDEMASLLGCAVEERELVVGPVQVGRGCFVGTRSILREHTAMADGARLEDLSLLPRGARIPRGETWAGSPARRVAGSSDAAAPPAGRGPLRRALSVGLYAVLVLVIPLLPLVAFVPGMFFLTHIDPVAHTLFYLAAAPLVGASFVVLLTSGVVLFKWLLVGRVRAGTYRVHAGFYVRKWIVDQLLAISLDVVGSLHATLYLAPWYRALGARLGRFVELSTATSMNPDLLEIGDGGTVADEVSLGAGRVEGGWLTLAPTRVGRRAFLGNGAVMPQGQELGDGSLVGVLSISPPDRAEAARPGASWLGSPPILLPRRQPSTPFPEQTTFRPTRKLQLARRAFETLRITLPPAGFVLVATTVITAALELWERIGLAAALLALPVVYAICCAGLAVGVALAKRAVMGRFRPFEHPLWSAFVWRLELINALYEFMVAPLALEALHGTPLLPWYFRLLGARIGRRTYFHTTGLIEFDLVEVGDCTAVNEEAVLQTHLFEDRVLKAGRLVVGRDCTVGAGSVVLYDSRMEDGARLDALSLLMKGETLPAGTAWAGIPASWQAESRPGSVVDREGSSRLRSARGQRWVEEHENPAGSAA